MAPILKTHVSEQIVYRTSVQKVCIGMGIFFVSAGILGIIVPGFFGLHLSLGHNLIHLLSGSLALWCGYSDDPKRSYRFSLGFGVVYGLLGLLGFVFGEPGYPGVGHLEADEKLLRVIPNALEFGTNDHILHIGIMAVLMVSAYSWAKRTTSFSQTVVSLQNSESDLKDAPLGSSDVYPLSDRARREEFERRV